MTCLTRSCWTSSRSSRGWAKWITSTQSWSNKGLQANAARPVASAPNKSAFNDTGKWKFSDAPAITASQNSGCGQSLHPKFWTSSVIVDLVKPGLTWTSWCEGERINVWRHFCWGQKPQTTPDTALKADLFLVRSQKLILETFTCKHVWWVIEMMNVRYGFVTYFKTFSIIMPLLCKMTHLVWSQKEFDP